jgi:hypothetical protein
MRRPLCRSNQGVLRTGALNQIRQLNILESIPLGDLLSKRALKAVPGIEHIPVLYTRHSFNQWRARYRELAHNEAERLTRELQRHVPYRYIELGPHADAISLFHEAVHARRAKLGRTMTPAAAEPSALRAEHFAATLERNAFHKTDQLPCKHQTTHHSGSATTSNIHV